MAGLEARGQETAGRGATGATRAADDATTSSATTVMTGTNFAKLYT